MNGKIFVHYGSLKQPYFFDLRNIYKREAVEGKGFVYFGTEQGIRATKQIENLSLSEVAFTSDNPQVLIEENIMVGPDACTI